MASTYTYDGEIRINSSIEADGFEAGGKDIEAAARRMAQSVTKIGDTAKIALQKQTDAFIKQNQMYAKQERKVEELKNKYRELSTQKVATDEFAEISAQIDKDTVKLNQLEKTQERFLETGGKAKSSAYKKRELEIDELRNSIRYAKAEQEDLLQSGNAYKMADTSGIQQKLLDEEQKLAQLSSSLGTSWMSLKSKVDSYNGTLSETVSLKQRLKKSFNTFGNSVKEAGKKIFGLGEKANKSNRSLGKMLTTSLLMSVAFRVFSTITQGVQEGIQNLAQYSDSTNESMSALKSSLTRLKNSFATAFAPILNVVAPILSSFINMLSKAMNYVGMFFAALTGQDTFIKAVEVQEDYAAGLKNTADAADDAAKAQNGYLSGLDEITRYDDGKDTSKNNGSASISEMFEEVEVPNSFKKLADKIKKIFSPIIEQFEEFGQEIGEITSEWFDDLDFGPLEDSIEDLTQALEPFVGVVLDGLAWAYKNVLLPLGKWTIEKGLPLLIETLAKAFELLGIALEALDPFIKPLGDLFVALGGRIGKCVEDIMLAFNGLLDFIIGVFTGDWERALSGLEIHITAVVDYYDQQFSFLTEDVFGAFTTFLEGVFTKDWSESFGELGECLNKFLASELQICGDIRQALEGVITFVKGSFTGDWKLAFDGLNTAVQGIFSAMVTFMNRKINAIVALINGLIKGVVMGMNVVITALNKLKIKTPDWLKYVPGASNLAGKTFGFNLSTITAPQLPYLATGAVIPPNAPFMAMLGDQKHGTNIEAPLDTIKQAVAEVIGNNQTGGGKYQFTAQINRRTIFDEIINEAKVRQMTNGKNPFELA